MGLAEISRRKFLVTASAVAGVSALRPQALYGVPPSLLAQSEKPADYNLSVATKPIECAQRDRHPRAASLAPRHPVRPSKEPLFGPRPA